jgi:hypothetical protein
VAVTDPAELVAVSV